MTSPTSGWLSGGPWRHGVAVISIVGRPGASSRVVCPWLGARASCRRVAFAPEAVVMTTPAAGSSARPAASRLSPWWSCVSSTASIGGSSAAAIAGPASLRDDVPQPKEYLRPGGSNVGSVSSRQPPTSISVSRPADVRDADVAHSRSADDIGARRRVSERPLQGVVGDLLPALLSGQKVCSALVLLDLGDRVRLVVLRVRRAGSLGGMRWSSLPEMKSSGARSSFL